MKASFISYGEPVSKERPRGGKFAFYTPRKTKDAEFKIAVDYKMQCGKMFLEKGIPIELRVKLYHGIPKSDTIKVKQQKEKGEIRPMIRRDADNCLKTIMDALNKIAYDDDSQIVKIVCERWYSNEPRIEVEVSDVL